VTCGLLFAALLAKDEVINLLIIFHFSYFIQLSRMIVEQKKNTRRQHALHGHREFDLIPGISSPADREQFWQTNRAFHKKEQI
jgi:hypothetical protein